MVLIDLIAFLMDVELFLMQMCEEGDVRRCAKMCEGIFHVTPTSNVSMFGNVEDKFV